MNCYESHSDFFHPRQRNNHSSANEQNFDTTVQELKIQFIFSTEFGSRFDLTKHNPFY
jgi:hypothetical protein